MSVGTRNRNFLHWVETSNTGSNLSQDGAVQFGIPKWTAVNLEIDLIPKQLQNDAIFECIKPKKKKKTENRYTLKKNFEYLRLFSIKFPL